ncbi:MAG: PEGA domain-containing protein [Myxococcales bacterium]|nr:PEGA domain-containing protein [Myxococcales bacterium]MCB9520558.1 PEGA domain-containing protein [Myxococcales bacterium]MCB9532601.1 PEGA domain-containing protein [Myxococcales bacterium]MCB9532702.1 PEGA domain-containing protein [Myxococcales bacterium]
MRSVARYVVLALSLCAPVGAAAQVVVLPTEYSGELGPADREAFEAQLRDSVGRGAAAEVVAPTAAELGALADCADATCAVEIGQQIAASVVVRATVNAEAEIYDFRLDVRALDDGRALASQTGDCTFCPVAEALEAFGFTAEAALAGVAPLPAATSGRPPEPPPAAAPPPVVAEVTPEPEPTPEPAAPAIVRGGIALNISTIPSTAVVTVNGERQGTGAATLLVAPQQLVIVVEAPGYTTYTEEVALEPSMRGPIYLRVGLSSAGAVAQRAPSRPPSSGSFANRAVGGVLAGVGALALGGGVTMLALDGQPTCSSGPVSACQELYEFTAGGAVATAAGAAALGAGLVLVSRSGHGADVGTTTGRRLTIAPLRHGVSATATIGF